MAETYFPFDAGAGAAITEDQWRKMAKFWTRSGVYRGELNGLAPTANGSGMQVFVDTGRAWIEGHFYENDASKTLAIAAADPTNPRIDRIVLKLDTAANTIGLAIKTGTPAGSPTPPARVWGSTTFELPIAQVLVDAAATNIAAPKITDERCYASQGPTLDRVEFRSAADAVSDVDLRRTGAGAAQLTGALSITGTLGVTGAATLSSTAHVVGAATLDSTLNVGGKVTISAGGLDVSGTPTTGYTGGEIRFPTTTASALMGFSTLATGSPRMLFDHRAGAGDWAWRNGSGASVVPMLLEATGNLKVLGDLYTGPAAMGATAKRFHVTHDSTFSYLRGEDQAGSIVNGNIYLQGGSIYAQAANGSGDFRYHKADGTLVAIIHQDGALGSIATDHYFGPYAFSSGTSVSRLHVATGYTTGLILASEGDGSNRDFAIQAKGTGSHLFYGDGGTTRAQIDSAGNLTAAATINATCQLSGYHIAFADNDQHAWEADGSGGWRFTNHWGINGGIFRFYGGASVNELAQFQDQVGALDTSLYLRWGDGGGTIQLSRVGVRNIGTMKANPFYDASYVLVVG